MRAEVLAKMLKLSTQKSIPDSWYKAINTDKKGTAVMFVELKYYSNWEVYETHVIYKLDSGGYGLHSIYPDGYSEETYVPEESFIQYPSYNELQFVNLGLTQELREAFYNKLISKKE